MRTFKCLALLAVALVGCGNTDDSQGVDSGTADLGSTDLGLADLGSMDLGTFDLGHDMSAVDLGGADLGDVPVSCDRWDVAIDQCSTDAADCAIDPPARYFWNGYRCEQFRLCAICEGEDCDRLGSLEYCEASARTCKPQLCAATGGEWFRDAGCGDTVCGLPPPLFCLRPADLCDCGPSKRFEEGTGCVYDATCTAEQACNATGGRWVLTSGIVCGEPVDGDGDSGRPGFTCACGRGRRFDVGTVTTGAVGCLGGDVDCAEANAEDLCATTGGSWENICCPTRCGDECLAECLAPACRCALNQVWDDALGCVDSAECTRLVLGDSCRVGELECEGGTVCCSGGIPDSATCEAPVCSTFGPCGPPRP
jgi:hypothetical protein